MSKVRTSLELQDYLDKEISWRIREIHDVKSSIKSKESFARNTLIRAGVPLLYAHWEGFVKESSQHYLRFVSSQRLKYSELASCFVVFGAKKHIASITESWSAALNIEAVNFFRSHADERADLNISNAIDTKSNLSPDVFTNIVKSLGLDIKSYETYFHFMEESLLKRRNSIAHGERLDLDEESFKKLSDEVIGLLRRFKTDLENAVALESYKSEIIAA